MKPTLCIIGGCIGAGKTTLARELLPRLGILRFLNAEEIAKGLSPLAPELAAFKAGRLLIEEARSLLRRGESFALESHPQWQDLHGAANANAMTEVVLEASRVATAKMLDYYKRMGIRVTPQMTLAPEPKRRVRKSAAALGKK